MADRPIPMSAPMVQATLREIEAPGTGKTQTRRVLDLVSSKRSLTPRLERPRYSVGDRLYVREHWRCEARWDDTAPRDISPGAPIYYAADPDLRDSEPGCAGRFRQGMHMPRWASRITLLVEEVRVQRLQDISETDAQAEGVQTGNYGGARNPSRSSYKQEFSWLWDRLHGPSAWDENPWVAAYTFRPILGNIDKIAA